MEQDTNPKYEKASIPEIYLAFGKLECKGWNMHKLCDSIGEYNNSSLPIVALDNGIKGQALWIIAGIHGDEPAGPTMLARNIEYIVQNLSDIPTVILPLCNPHGYILNQRHLYYAESDKDGMDVGNASHMLLDGQDNQRSSDVTCYEAECIIGYLWREQIKRPPVLVIDLHESTISSEGYICSRGMHGVRDMDARKIADAMKTHIGLADSAYTKHKGFIVEGITGPTKDGSLSEFIASREIYLGSLAKGINAETVLTIKTPAKDIDIEKRVLAQQSVLYMVADIMRAK